jgi:two-component system CheB/CheR fusion protein
MLRGCDAQACGLLHGRTGRPHAFGTAPAQSCLQAWQALRDQALPAIMGWMQPGDSLRCWSVGCASGEEPYSLAILLAEHLGPAIVDYNFKIYAADIDEDALNIARRGEYSVEKLRRMAPSLREKYFSGRGSLLRVSRDIRRLTIFGRSNIVNDAPISHCNLVICRNVLIYFDTATQNQVLSRIRYALEPGGVLFLGKAESKLANSSVFLPLNTRWRIFRSIRVRRLTLTTMIVGCHCRPGKVPIWCNTKWNPCSFTNAQFWKR